LTTLLVFLVEQITMKEYTLFEAAMQARPYAVFSFSNNMQHGKRNNLS
jgi:hypothetical protein